MTIFLSDETVSTLSNQATIILDSEAWMSRGIKVSKIVRGTVKDIVYCIKQYSYKNDWQQLAVFLFKRLVWNGYSKAVLDFVLKRYCNSILFFYSLFLIYFTTLYILKYVIANYNFFTNFHSFVFICMYF